MRNSRPNPLLTPQALGVKLDPGSRAMTPKIEKGMASLPRRIGRFAKVDMENQVTTWTHGALAFNRWRRGRASPG